ncbi:hypothetical protein J6590_058058 [Homalodisca vitripennis]|nr:hypothetical protein J6590_058058 [Homalodisca vitripennis]
MICVPVLMFAMLAKLNLDLERATILATTLPLPLAFEVPPVEDYLNLPQGQNTRELPLRGGKEKDLGDVLKSLEFIYKWHMVPQTHPKRQYLDFEEEWGY